MVTAEGGDEGLRLARENRPDVITLDVLMPKMDGWAVLSALKDDPELADIPVIMLTIVEDRNLGFSLGAADYLSKPVNKEKLISILERHCPTEGRATVMVVEDDEPTRRMMRLILEKEDQVLARFRPRTMGQAARLAGVNPADVTLLAVAIRRGPVVMATSP